MNTELLPDPNLLKEVTSQKRFNDLFQELFVDVLSHVENSDFPMIEETSIKAICDGYFDIRFYMYYFFAKLNQEGAGALNEILEFIMELLNNHSEILLPRANFEKQLNASLQWFFDQTNKLFEEPKRKNSSQFDTPFYKLSIESLDQDQIDTCVERLENLSEIVEQEDSLYDPSTDAINKIILEIRQLSTLVAQKTAQTISDETAFNEDLETEAELNSEDLEELKPSNIDQSEHLYSIEPSYGGSKMEELKFRLNVFSNLVKSGKHLHASVLAREITETIENFDPISFFPEVFSEYLSLQAKHHADITPFWDNIDTHGWQCLAKLCKSDITAFLKWEIDDFDPGL